MESRMRAIADWISERVTAGAAARAGFVVIKTGLDMRRTSVRAYTETRSRLALDLVGAGPSCKSARYLSIPTAALRPSAIAHTTSDCPRRMSPAAKTPGTDDM